MHGDTKIVLWGKLSIICIEYPQRQKKMVKKWKNGQQYRLKLQVFEWKGQHYCSSKVLHLPSKYINRFKRKTKGQHQYSPLLLLYRSIWPAKDSLQLSDNSQSTNQQIIKRPFNFSSIEKIRIRALKVLMLRIKKSLSLSSIGLDVQVNRWLFEGYGNHWK